MEETSPARLVLAMELGTFPHLALNPPGPRAGGTPHSAPLSPLLYPGGQSSVVPAGNPTVARVPSCQSPLGPIWFHLVPLLPLQSHEGSPPSLPLPSTENTLSSSLPVNSLSYPSDWTLVVILIQGVLLVPSPSPTKCLKSFSPQHAASLPSIAPYPTVSWPFKYPSPLHSQLCALPSTWHGVHTLQTVVFKVSSPENGTCPAHNHSSILSFMHACICHRAPVPRWDLLGTPGRKASPRSYSLVREAPPSIPLADVPLQG